MMAEGKKLTTFDAIAHVKAWVIASLSGKPCEEPWKLNPFRVPKTPTGTKASEPTEAESEMGWALFDQFFTGGDDRMRGA